ncbi:MAG TPA: hypothetical protein VEU33_50185 [Archangium sp.]|nr:hypothetical protein [Archangium sp.]
MGNGNSDWRLSWALIMAFTFVVGCGTGSELEQVAGGDPSEDELTSQTQGMENGQRVALICDTTQCRDSSINLGMCLYSDPNDLYNGQPRVRQWICNSLSDPRFQWRAWYSNYGGYRLLQNAATQGCLYAEPSARVLVTVPCNGWGTDQSWRNVNGQPNVNLLQNAGSQRCANPYYGSLEMGNWLHDRPCDGGAQNQDWHMSPF